MSITILSLFSPHAWNVRSESRKRTHDKVKRAVEKRTNVINMFALVFRFGNLSLILWLKGSKFLEIQRQDLGKFAAL